MERPTRVRFTVLAALCTLTFLTYLDRICISRVQEDISRDLRFGELTPEDHEQLQRGSQNDFRDLLKPQDEERLKVARQSAQDAAPSDGGLHRYQLARERLEDNRRNSRMSWVFFAFSLGYMLFEIPGGWLGDRWGPRAVIVRIVIWWSVFTGLTGCADWLFSNPTPALALISLFVVRFLFGAGEAGAYPNVGRAVSRWFPYGERGFAQGAIWMVSRTGGAFAAVIIGQLMRVAGGWRQAFWLLGAVGVVWAIVFGWWFRNRPEEVASVNTAERTLIRGKLREAGSIYDDSHGAGFPWSRLVTSVNLWALYIAGAAVSFAWYVNITFLPKVLKDKFGMALQDSEWLTGLPLGVGAVFCLLGGAMSDFLIRRLGSRRWGRSLPGLIGFSGAGLCLIMFPYARSPYSAVGLLCLACALQDLAIPNIWSTCSDIGGRYAGTVSGAMNAASGVGAMCSPILSAYLANLFDWNTAFLVFAGAYVVGALMWLRIDATETLISRKASSYA